MIDIRHFHSPLPVVHSFCSPFRIVFCHRIVRESRVVAMVKPTLDRRDSSPRETCDNHPKFHDVAPNRITLLNTETRKPTIDCYRRFNRI